MATKTIIAISIGLFACVDEIKLNVDTEQRSFVVDGFVTDSMKCWLGGFPTLDL